MFADQLFAMIIGDNKVAASDESAMFNG